MSVDTPTSAYPPNRPINFDPPSPDDAPSSDDDAQPTPTIDGLNLTPTDPDAPKPHNDIPNTPLMVAVLAFALGGVFMLGGVGFWFPGAWSSLFLTVENCS